jgi:GDP-L-fucose synthase
MKRDSRFFLAGHEGLIGSAVMRRLKKEGVGSLHTRSRTELDLRIRSNVDAFFDEIRPEYVILAAGKVGGILQNRDFPADFLSDNLAIQLNVLSAAHRTGVKKLIFFGSSCMYPRECTQPMAESILFSGKPEPTSLSYAIAKMAGVQMCLAYNQQFGEKKFLPLIPNSVYGPNDDFDPKSSHVLAALLVRFLEAKKQSLESVTLWGSGAPRREFVHADDVADVCVRVLNEDVSSLEFPLNIGVGSDISIRQLGETIADLVGYQGRIEWDISKPDGAPRKLLDSTRIRNFGWTHQVELRDGLKRTLEWLVPEARKLA